VLTARLTEKTGGLAGALIVGEHQELLFISQNGMVQRTSVSGISQMGRSTQGVKVMNIKDDDRVSAVALVVESDTPEAPPAEVEAPPEVPPAEPQGEALPPQDGASADGDGG
jgi:DNA gyrase subunit A